MTHPHKIIREQIQLLRDAGHTYRTIGQASGVSRHVIATMISRTIKIEPENFDAIMRLKILPPWETPGVILTDHSLIAGTGTVRRLRALARMGYSVPRIAADTGLPTSHLRVLTNSSCCKVEVRTAEVIQAFYRKASRRIPEGDSVLWVQRRAERNGWPGPGLWDDIDRDEFPVREGSRAVLVEYVGEFPGLTATELQQKIRKEYQLPATVAYRLFKEALECGEIVRMRNGKTVRVYVNERERESA